MGELIWKGWIILSSLPHGAGVQTGDVLCVLDFSLENWALNHKHLYTVSPSHQGHQLSKKHKCRKFGVTRGLSHSCFLLLILILSGRLPKKSKKKKKGNFENFSVSLAPQSSQFL